jgi:hypothetical protein
MAAQVRAQVRSCGICGGQSDTGAGFLQVLWFPPPILIPPTAPQSSSIIQAWYNRPVSGLHTKSTQTHSTPKKKGVSYEIALHSSVTTDLVLFNFI